MRVFPRSRDDARLDAELRSHLEQQIADYIAAGMSPADARRRSRLEFGGLVQTREAVQDVRRGAFVEILLRDVRHAFRSLIAAPGFTLVAVISLALGIGANTAIFSIVDTLLLRPLPVSDPHALTFLAFPKGANHFDSAFSGPEYRTVRDQTAGVFSGTSSMIFGGVLGPTHRSDGLTVDSVTRPVQTLFVSGEFFQMLGIRPALGRFIVPSEGGGPGSDPVVVLSNRYWRTRFNADPSILDKHALINGQPVTIVGVAPKGFSGPTPVVDMEAYLPLGMRTIETAGDAGFLNDPAARGMVIVARIAPGVTVARANAVLAATGAALRHDYPRPDATGALQARPLRPPGLVNGPNPFPALAALFFVLAGLVFALACLNVANLTVIRTAARRREMAVRAALGGSRARLVRHLITEAVLVALLAAAAGMVVGMLALRALASQITAAALPLTLDFPFNGRVFAFAILVALAAAMLVGIVPALRASGGNLVKPLRDGGRSTTGRGQRLRTGLVAAQVAGTLALLIVAGLFVRSLSSVQHADLGFDPAHVLNVRLDPGEIGYTPVRGAAFYRSVLGRVRALPGVTSASLTMTVPLGDDPQIVEFGIPGRLFRRGDEPHADFNAVSPDYFKTMAIPLRQGRDFTDADDLARSRVAIVNEVMAARFWPGESAIGRTFTRSGEPERPIQIVGVVRNSRTEDPYSPLAPAIYVPLAQSYVSMETLQVRAAGTPESLVPDVLAAVRATAPAAPVLNVRTMVDAVTNGDSGFFIFNIGAMLTGALGLLGLALALVGIYGVMAYTVGQRTNEIGIRLALGAQRYEILWLVSRQSLAMVAIGLVLGVLAAFAVGRLVGGFLVGVGPTDPVAYTTVSLLLIAAALAACYVPVRRAVRVDPVVALRHE